MWTCSQPDNDTENWIRKKCGLPLKSKTPRARYAPVQERIEELVPSETPGQPERPAAKQVSGVGGPGSAIPPPFSPLGEKGG